VDKRRQSQLLPQPYGAMVNSGIAYLGCCY
jgi:hypothetical protein